MKPLVREIGSRRTAALLAVCAGACILAAAALLTACAQKQIPPAAPSATAPAATPASVPASAALTPAEKEWLAKKGTLQVGAFNDYPPFGTVDKSGQAAGMSVDYWRLVGERLGVKVAFTPVIFADQIEGLKIGRFDSLAGIFPLPERKQWFDFSRTFYVIDTRIYVDPAHAANTTLKSLDGLTVAVVDADSGQQLAKNAGLKTLVVKGYPEAVQAVSSGAAQATILDQLVADYYIKQLKLSSKVKAVGAPVAKGQMTMPVRKDDAILLGILNKGIEMVGESEMEGIYEKWMGQGQ
jgi:ABC-type amino acid transport substrate-binding protein